MSILKHTLRASLLAGAALTLGAGAVQAKPQQMTIYGGPLNTGWYNVAAWIASVMTDEGIRANSELGGAMTNVMEVVSDPSKMGFTFGVSAGLALTGEAPFPQPMPGFCGVQIFQRSIFQALVAQDSGVETAEDLSGETYSAQAVGNMSQLAFKHFLQAHGMEESDVDVAVGGQQFGADGTKDRRFAGFAAMTGVPSPPMMDAATSVDVAFLPTDDDAFAKIKEINDGYTRETLPANAYPNQPEEVPTFGTVAFVIMNESTPEEDQYYVTKLIHENWEGLKSVNAATRFLTDENAIEIPVVDLCPGAQKYWKEVGAL